MPILTPLARFDRCEALVGRLEGGYVGNPKDPGGATNMGVMLRALQDHRGHACTWQDVKTLQPSEVGEIYHESTGRPCEATSCPSASICSRRTLACSAGKVGRSRSCSSACIRRRTARSGRRPWRREGANGLPSIVERVRLARASYYRELSTFPTFGKRWTNRLQTMALPASAWEPRSQPSLPEKPSS